MVYIEYVLGLNAVIHLMFVFTTGIILNTRIRKINLIISIILDSIYMGTYMFYPFYFEGFKYIFGILLMFVTFFGMGTKNIIKASLIYYLENFLLGGISSILYIGQHLDWYSIIGIIIINFVITYVYKDKTRIRFDINKLNYEILIIDKGKKYFINGYCDTGNFLLSDDLVNVVFINSKYHFGQFIKNLESQSIGVVNSIKLYRVDEFYIKTDMGYVKKDVYISFSKLHYEGMFGLNLLGG